MPTAAKADYRTPGQVKDRSVRIDDFKISLDTNWAVAAYRNSCCCQGSSYPECAKTVRRLL